MATSILNRKAILLAAGLALSAVSAVASDYQPYPDTSPGTVYRWKTYAVDDHGGKKLRGIYIDTIEGKTLIGEHEYVVVKRINPEKKPLSNIIYRCDKQVFGILLGPSEQSLLVHWKGAPSEGQSWMSGAQKIVTRGQADVEAEGTVYRDCWVLDQFDNGQLVNRSYFNRDDGWVESVRYTNGKLVGFTFRLPEGVDQ
jgi:hypothetical protein